MEHHYSALHKFRNIQAAETIGMGREVLLPTIWYR